MKNPKTEITRKHECSKLCQFGQSWLKISPELDLKPSRTPKRNMVMRDFVAVYAALAQDITPSQSYQVVAGINTIVRHRPTCQPTSE